MNGSLGTLCKTIAYKFQDEELLRQALTHRSAGSRNYERLEFLGDGLLNFIVAEALYEQEAEASEGDLTRLRASLVKQGTLAGIASNLALGEYLQLGAGESSSGGFRRKSILADTVEALLGAIYLDGGFNAARTVTRRLFAEHLAGLPDAESLKDPKTRLQEILQGRGLGLPDYTLVNSHGKDHERIFTVACRVTALSVEAEASGSSRRKAEQAAAAEVIARIQDE